MNPRLLCVGLTTLDVLARPIDALPEHEGTRLVDEIEAIPAGTAGGTALVAAKLGVPTALLTALGDDRPGRFLRMIYAEAGVDLSLVATRSDRRTSTTVLAIDSAGRRPNFHALGASTFTQVSDAALIAARGVRFVHYGGVGGPQLDGGAGAALLAAAKEAGAMVTCDVISPGPRVREELARLLPHVDWFMPSLPEALSIAGASDAEGAAKAFLALGARGCVFKDGARGSLLLAGGERARIPAFAVAVRDTTSCGDSYCAGFLAALDRGFDPREACRFATATAALVAGGLGTLGKLESFAQAEAAMRSLPVRDEKE